MAERSACSAVASTFIFHSANCLLCMNGVAVQLALGFKSLVASDASNRPASLLDNDEDVSSLESL
jgi:hypothetical protein